MRSKILSLAALAASCNSPRDFDLPDGAWTPDRAAPATEWAAEVTPANVHAEYPRPQMRRGEWLGLNGLWHFAADTQLRQLEVSPSGRGTVPILVPFVPGAPLSGVARAPERMVYLKWVRLPDEWRGRRLLVHFEGIEGRARLYKGKTKYVEHEGPGPFTVQLAKELKQGVGTIVLEVEGRGIWGSVWLEPVPETYVADVRAQPDPAAGVVSLEVDVEGPDDGVRVRAELDGRAAEAADGELTLSVADPRPWTGDDPHLHDLVVELWRGDERLDRVESYVAYRGAGEARGLVDDGLWPAGGLTAPTDLAERGDVEMARALGFAALHRPGARYTRRWLYHCDAAGVRAAGEAAGPFVVTTGGEDASFLRLAGDEGLMSFDRATLRVDADAALEANGAR